MDLKKRLGARIKELRKKHNLKQSELAEKIGIATKSQSCIETGKNYPTSENIEKYAKVFNVDVSEILKLNHIKSSDEMRSDMIKIIKNADDNTLKLSYKLLTSILN